MTSTSLKDKAVRGVAWNAVNTYSIKGLEFVLAIILARLLSPSDYGLIGMTSIFFAISNVFIDSGFGSALVQKKDRNEDDYCTVFYVNLTVSLFFYVVLFFIAPYVAVFFEQPLLRDLMRVSALTLIINALVATSRNKLYVAVDFKTTTKISITSSVIAGCIALYCAYTGMGVWTFVIQGLVSSIVSSLLLFYFVRWFPRRKFSKSSFNRLFGYGSKILIASLISTIYDNTYNLVIGKRFSSASLGFYTKGSTFASFAGGTSASVLQSVAFPVLTGIQDDYPRLLSAYSRYIKMVAFFVFPLLMGLCGVAKPLVLFLITEKWAPCIIILQILCFACLWDGIIRINLNLLYVTGRSDLVLRLEVIKKSVAFTILFISIFFGIIGMCVGRVIYALAAFYMNTYYTKKILNYDFWTQVKEILPSFLISLSMMGIALLVSSYVTTPIVSLAISLIVCPIYYLSLSYLFRISSLFELRDIVNSRKKK
jgi:O-antigen/teichoic acid export membrane protein